MIKKLHLYEKEILDEIVRICELNKLHYVLIGGTLLGAARHKGFIPWDDDLDIAIPRKDYIKFIKLCKKQLSEKFCIDYIKTNKKYWLPFIKIRNKNTIYEEKWQKNYIGNKGIWVDIFPIDYSSKQNGKLLRMQENLIMKIKILLYLKNLRKIEKEDTIVKKIKLKIIKIIPNRFLHFIIDSVMTINKNENSPYLVNFGSQYGIKKQTHPKEKYFPVTQLQFEGDMYNVPCDYDYVLKKIYGDNYMELPPVEKRVTHNPIRIKFEDGEEITFNE